MTELAIVKLYFAEEGDAQAAAAQVPVHLTVTVEPPALVSIPDQPVPALKRWSVRVEGDGESVHAFAATLQLYL